MNSDKIINQIIDRLKKLEFVEYDPIVQEDNEYIDLDTESKDDGSGDWIATRVTWNKRKKTYYYSIVTFPDATEFHGENKDLDALILEMKEFYEVKSKNVCLQN
jgi:hypothetical protein